MISKGPLLDSFLTNEHMSALKRSRIGQQFSVKKKEGLFSNTATSAAGEPIWTLTDDEEDETQQFTM